MCRTQDKAYHKGSSDQGRPEELRDKAYSPSLGCSGTGNEKGCRIRIRHPRSTACRSITSVAPAETEDSHSARDGVGVHPLRGLAAEQVVDLSENHQPSVELVRRLEIDL